MWSFLLEWCREFSNQAQACEPRVSTPRKFRPCWERNQGTRIGVVKTPKNAEELFTNVCTSIAIWEQKSLFLIMESIPLSLLEVIIGSNIVEDRVCRCGMQMECSSALVLILFLPVLRHPRSLTYTRMQKGFSMCSGMKLKIWTMYTKERLFHLGLFNRVCFDLLWVNTSPSNDMLFSVLNISSRCWKMHYERYHTSLYHVWPYWHYYFILPHLLTSSSIVDNFLAQCYPVQLSQILKMHAQLRFIFQLHVIN